MVDSRTPPCRHSSWVTDFPGIEAVQIWGSIMVAELADQRTKYLLGSCAPFQVAEKSASVQDDKFWYNQEI